mgnify:CR=1 FL=1
MRAMDRRTFLKAGFAAASAPVWPRAAGADRLLNYLAARGDAWVANDALVRRPTRMLYSPNYPG